MVTGGHTLQIPNKLRWQILHNLPILEKVLTLVNSAHLQVQYLQLVWIFLKQRELQLQGVHQVLHRALTPQAQLYQLIVAVLLIP